MQYIEILTSETDLIWKKDLFRYNRDLKMRTPPGFSVGPKSNVECPYKRQQEKQRHRKEGHKKTEVETGISCHTPRNSWSHQKLEETRQKKHSPNNTLISDFWPLAW